MVYYTRRFVVCLSVWHFVLVFFSPFSIAITLLGEERANLNAFRAFVRFVLVWICRFPLPLGVWERLRFVIVALTGLFSYLFLKKKNYVFKTRHPARGKYFLHDCMCAQRRHISACASIQADQMGLRARSRTQRWFESLATHRVLCENSDQTVCTCSVVRSAVPWLTWQCSEKYEILK